MENNYYLSIGTKVADHYEIEKVLSEDEFEILYLAKNLDKKNNYVVLKELFLKSYSQREGTEVTSPAKSKIVFEETKKEVILEAESILKNPSSNTIKIYEIVEENNTVYTVMEFINTANLKSYLNTNSLDNHNIENSNKKRVQKKSTIKPTTKEKPKSSLFLKILITMILICFALGYYAYNMIKSDRDKKRERVVVKTTVEKIKEEKPTNLPMSKEDVINDYVEGSNEIEDEADKDETVDTPEGAAYITDVEAYKKEQAAKKAKEEAKRKALEEERLRQEKEKALERKALEEKALEDEEERLREEEYKRLEEEAKKEKEAQRAKETEKKEFIPNNIREFIGEEEIERSNHPENDFPSSSNNAEENLPLGAVNPNNNLGTPIHTKKNNTLGKKINNGYVKTQRPRTINKQTIKEFLNNFISTSSNGSIDEILSNYDDDVERYFSLRNVNHETIRRDKINYHNRWTHRKFNLVDFDVLKVYKNGNETFYDIKTTTNWKVSNDAGKTISGVSNGMMTLRKVDNGFKVTAIYTSKSK